MLELRRLQPSDEAAFRNAYEEFKAHTPPWDFAFQYDETTNFEDYVRLLANWAKGKDIGSFVPNTYLVAFVNGKAVGRVSIRHTLNDQLLQDGGHVGYGVVPSERRKGFAREILRLTLPIAKSLGLERILLTCDDDNEGSSRVIEAHGGILENKVIAPGMRVAKRRYWIDL